jgi:hypothetical protein
LGVVGLVYFFTGIGPCYSLGSAFQYAQDHWRSSILANMGFSSYRQLFHAFS